jgi:SET domain-containing protein
MNPTPSDNPNPVTRGLHAEAGLLLVKESPIHGRGLFAQHTIPKGARVIEYVGERIGKAESLRRCEQGNGCIFSLDDKHDLDGNVPWNLARFINHNCDPNCDAEMEEGRIWVIARRDITPGEELTFNYGYDLEDYKDYVCNCGSPNCVGYIVAEAFFDHVRKQAEK